MADILIRKIDETVKELLRRRAARRGKSLEADLRETLERLAREEAETPDDTAPFGSWLVSITRPGSTWKRLWQRSGQARCAQLRLTRPACFLSTPMSCRKR
jgi:plasmid stability protein